MKNWLLDFTIQPSSEKINYNNRILFVGSCFSESIANLMKEACFPVLVNPHGIMYDPQSLVRSIESYIEDIHIKEEDIFEFDGLFHSWDHHSVFSGSDRKKVLEEINNSTSGAHTFLKTADWIIITPGSSWYYQLISGRTVANCHKFPSAHFKKSISDTENIKKSFSKIIKKLKLFNPAIKILFTISPVRHIKDGLIENNISKARLIEAVHSIIKDHDNSYYFPSYELMIDVLRDYRFCKPDKVHPSNEAVEYIFERFLETYLDAKNIKIYNDIIKWRSLLKHKPLKPGSENHRKFLDKIRSETSYIKEKYPFIDFSDELSLQL